jgi:heterodisulfide reductase subunit A
MTTQPRIGVYICHCGFNIAGTVDVNQVTEYAGKLPGVAVARHYTYMCSEPGQSLIQQDCEEQKLEQVVVASCSPRMHEPTFRKAAQAGGVNPGRVEMANIREQCSWVHKDSHDATEKAKALVASAVAKAAYLEALEEREVGVTPGVVIIGGGVSGLVAALDVADAGYPAYIVEKSDHLGGRVADLNRTFPELEPVADWLPSVIERVLLHPNITVYFNAHVVKVDGYVGNFQAQVAGCRMQDAALLPLASCVLRVGAMIVATGYDVFDPKRKPEFGYGRYPQVMTTLEMERKLAQGDLTVNGKTPKDIVFIKCVGSRDVQLGNPYCSRVCCMVSAKQARLLKEQLPDSRVTVFYMDVRTFGKRGEEFYDEARNAGVLYRRGNVAEIYRKGDRVAVRVEDTFLRRTLEHEADLAVLAVGMEAREDVTDIAALLKLPRSADGFFLEAHPKLRPVDTAVDGVFLAGCCQGPKDIPDSIAQAKAAASSSLIPLIRGTVPVESATAVSDPELCAACGLCVDVCPFGAPSIDPVWNVSVVNAVLCKGCGTCAAMCPSKAIRLQHFTPEQILAQVDVLVW